MFSSVAKICSIVALATTQGAIATSEATDVVNVAVVVPPVQPTPAGAVNLEEQAPARDRRGEIFDMWFYQAEGKPCNADFQCGKQKSNVAYCHAPTVIEGWTKEQNGKSYYYHGQLSGYQPYDGRKLQCGDMECSDPNAFGNMLLPGLVGHCVTGVIPFGAPCPERTNPWNPEGCALTGTAPATVGGDHPVAEWAKPLRCPTNTLRVTFASGATVDVCDAATEAAGKCYVGVDQMCRRDIIETTCVADGTTMSGVAMGTCRNLELEEGCIHGGNRVESIPAGGLPSSEHHFATHITPVRDLAVGDKIKGLGSDFEPQWCTVAAVEPTGDGELWGNFTDGHFVLRDGQVVTNGRSHGERHTADKWLVMTECPYGVDESGTVFSALSDFNRHRDPAEPQFVKAGEPATLSLVDHLLLHQVYFELVQKTGGFWLNPASFKDMAKVQRESPRGVDLLLSCVNSGDPTSEPCTAWEMLFVEIVDEWLVDPAADAGTRVSRSASDAAATEASLTNAGRVRAAYPGLGHPGAAGSGSVELLHIANRNAQWQPAVLISVAAGVAALVALIVVALVLRCRRAPAQPTLAATGQLAVHKEQALAPLTSTCSKVDPQLSAVVVV